MAEAATAVSHPLDGSGDQADIINNQKLPETMENCENDSSPKTPFVTDAGENSCDTFPSSRRRSCSETESDKGASKNSVRKPSVPDKGGGVVSFSISNENLAGGKDPKSRDDDTPSPAKLSVNSLEFGIQSPSDTSSLSRHLLDTSVSMVLKSSETTDTLASSTCEMCSNYESSLQQYQETERALKQQLGTSQHLADRYRTELSAERLFRTELETKMTQKSADAYHEIELLQEQIKGMESEAEKSLESMHEATCSLQKEFALISAGKESAIEQFESLQTRYQKLLGAQRTKAQDLRQEEINVPQTVDELQLLCLQLREELIEARAAKEHLEDSLGADVLILKDQLKAEESSKSQLEESLMDEINALRTELGVCQSAVSELKVQQKRAEDLESQTALYQTTISDLETKLHSLNREKGEIEFQATEHRRKALGLQQELDNSEIVQMDFVKLSQSLQIELEKIRQAEQEVRWQFEEDVIVCNSCKQPFGKVRARLHCRHCGKIFCAECLCKSVPSGPQRRSARVCEICHTLLVRDSAPYFSRTVPNSD